LRLQPKATGTAQVGFRGWVRADLPTIEGKLCRS
jgi:hypothetical protein